PTRARGARAGRTTGSGPPPGSGAVNAWVAALAGNREPSDPPEVRAGLSRHRPNTGRSLGTAAARSEVLVRTAENAPCRARSLSVRAVNSCGAHFRTARPAP